MPRSVSHYESALQFAERQVEQLVTRHPDYFPIYTEGGKWRHGGELWTDWTGGFLAGMMWRFHLRTGSPVWRERAEHYSRLLEHRQKDRNVHDLGFIFLPFTTLVYVWLVQGVGGIQGIDWLWLILAVLLDVVSIGGAAAANRDRLPGGTPTS